MLHGRNFNFPFTLPRLRNDRKGIDLCTDIARVSALTRGNTIRYIYSLVYFPRYPFRVSNGIVIYETRVSSRCFFFFFSCLKYVFREVLSADIADFRHAADVKNWPWSRRRHQHPSSLRSLQRKNVNRANAFCRLLSFPVHFSALTCAFTSPYSFIRATIHFFMKL